MSNKPNGKRLLEMIEQIEALREDKADIAEREKVVMQTAKSEGYSPKRIRDVLKIRAMKPADRADAEAELDTYLHAIGMGLDTPLFRKMAAVSADALGHAKAIEMLSDIVPPGGEIVVKIAGQATRIARSTAAELTVEPWFEPVLDSVTTSRAQGPRRSSTAAEAPPADISDEMAAAMGRDAAAANQPVIRNPFPFGDRRRPIWDAAWRQQAGTDGMGPSDE